MYKNNGFTTKDGLENVIVSLMMYIDIMSSTVSGQDRTGRTSVYLDTGDKPGHAIRVLSRSTIDSSIASGCLV